VEGRRVIFVAAALGAGLPLSVAAGSKLLWHAGLHPSPHSNYVISTIKVMVWPSSFPLDALTMGERWYSLDYLLVFTLATATNVVLYIILGFLLWLGVAKFRPLAYLVGLLIAVYWTIVLTA
jgi:hypothetical protein